MKKYKTKRNKILKGSKGITLIALAITIIILLILAGISIGALTGDNSVIKEARNSKELAEKKQLEEQVEIAKLKAEETHRNPTLDDVIQEIVDEGVITSKEQVNRKNGDITTDLGYVLKGLLIEYFPGQPDENGIFQVNSTVDGKTATANNPTIPAGFKPLKTETSTWTDDTTKTAPTEQDVKNGLVIQDAEGNEFVWVPVDSSKFQRADGYSNNSKQSMLSGCTEPFASGYSTEEAEYNKMKTSVETNGGFYIGRYEAGKDSAGNVIVQKNVDVYNNIGWSNSKAMNNETGGAVEKAKEFKKGKAYENSVTSTLVYGIQWDATMQFFDNRYIDGIPTNDIANLYVSNSEYKGWYNDNYKEGNPGNRTGIDLTDENGKTLNKVKNIYDMAGNVWEWTMEAHGTNKRVFRGGSVMNNGSAYPASSRYSSVPSESVGYVGFRIALYIGL